jgi:phosphoribosylformimino-5-aminoimidazole carboxamide ribotide isomerase
LAGDFESMGISALIVTEIGVDGTMAGPALSQLTKVLEATSVDVIASGGVGGAGDLVALRNLEAVVQGQTRQLAGAIVGRAIYEGALSVEEAIAACSA